LPVERALESACGGEGPYSLVLIDPPYEEEAALAVVERLAASPLVAPGSTLVLEHAWRRLPPDGLGPLALAGVIATGVLLIYQHRLVRADDLSRLNAAFFTTNAFVSLILFLTFGGAAITRTLS